MGPDNDDSFSVGQGKLDKVEELGRIVTAVRCNEVKGRGYPFDSLTDTCTSVTRTSGTALSTLQPQLFRFLQTLDNFKLSADFASYCDILTQNLTSLVKSREEITYYDVTVQTHQFVQAEPQLNK